MFSNKPFLNHVLRWILAPIKDYVFTNPQFHPRYAGDKGIAIYCNHGLGDRASAFAYILDQLKDHLPPCIRTIILISSDNRLFDPGIMEYAEYLHHKILANGDHDVILFGHSRGGLIVSLLETYFAKSSALRIHGIFTFGAPFGGSKYACAPLTWVSKSLQDMKIAGDLLRELEEKIRTSTTPYLYYIAEEDYLVAPDSAHIKDHGASMVVKASGHVGMLSNLELIKDILLRLEKICQETSLPTPSPTDAIHEIRAILSLEILRLKKTSHFTASTKKIVVLDKLKQLMADLLDEKIAYPQAKTLGEFIYSFLNDSSIGIKPIEILNEALNPGWGFRKTRARMCMESLMTQYQDIALPQNLIKPAPR